MNKKPNIVRPIGAQHQPTQEELGEMAKKAFIQKRNSLAEGIIYNAVQSGTGVILDVNGCPNYRPLINAALDAADYYMEKCFSVSVKTEQ